MDIRDRFRIKLKEVTTTSPDTNSLVKTIKSFKDKELPMDKIQNDPVLSYGYRSVKNKDYDAVDLNPEPDPKNNYGSYNPNTNQIYMNNKYKKSKDSYSSTIRHELGHAASVNLKGGMKNIDRDTEELRQRRRDIDTNKPNSYTYKSGVKWTQKLHDRDQISLDKDNESLKNKARKALYKDYGAPDRATMSDRDLGKTATGTIVPEETKMDIKENFYRKLQTIREEAEVKPNKNSEVVEDQKAAKKALKHVNKNNYEAAHAAVEGTSLAKNLKSHLDRAQKHWTKMNMLNNSSHKAKSEEHYNEIRNRANDHQDQAQHHHDQAKKYLSDHTSQLDEAKQLDEREGFPRGPDTLHSGLGGYYPSSKKLTKNGKISKGTQKQMVKAAKLGTWGRKVSGPKGPLPEEVEQLNELRGKSSLSDDERKKLKDRIHKKHGKAWDKTIDIRKEKKSSGPADTRDMDKLRDRLARMYNKLEEDYPGVQRRSNKTLDPDLRKDFENYKTDQEAKRSSNNIKTSWQASPNPTYKMMGRMKPWQSTDSRAKYDATRDKVVDKQNQREIRRDPPITVKE